MLPQGRRAWCRCRCRRAWDPAVGCLVNKAGHNRPGPERTGRAVCSRPRRPPSAWCIRVRSELRVLRPRPNSGQHGAGRHERRSAPGRHAWPELQFPAAGSTHCASGRRHSGERYAYSPCPRPPSGSFVPGPSPSSLPPPSPSPYPRYHPHPHLHTRPHPDQVVAPVVAQPVAAVGQPARQQQQQDDCCGC